MKSVCVVTVTYGNRAHLLEQVVDSCIKENVNRIVVVDNGSQEESKEKLIELVSVNGTLIDLVSLNENLGSAGGFKLGLKRARETSKCDYLWLLDDDNVPQEGALKSLFSANSYLSPFRKLVLVSYRKIMSKELGVIDKKDIFKSVSEGEVLGEKRKMAKKIINKIFGTKKVTGEDFYLYADDIEYSRRFIRAGYQIFTCYFSQIVDVDAQLGSEGFFSSSQSELKVYYSLRNHYYLEGSKSNLYLFFKFTYILLRNLKKVGDIKFFTKRSLLIFCALNDGRKGKLGRTI